MFIASILFIVLLLIVKAVQFFALSSVYKTSRISDPVVSRIPLSVIIALKNEATHVNELVKALLKQTYDSNLYEVIFVDDNSTDDTYSLLTSLTEQHANMTVLKAVDKPYPAKKGALAIGIHASHFPHLLFTDGDCVPQERWIESFAAEFSNNKDILIGAAPFYSTGSLLNKIVCYENLVNTMLTISFLALRRPYSAVGRSIGYSKEAYRKVKGFEQTMDTVSGDDDLFIREAVRNNLQIGILTSQRALVFSHTPDTFQSYNNQKVRHLKTSHHYPLATQSAIFLWHECNYIAQYFFLLAFLSPFAYAVSATKIVLDIVMYSVFQKKLGYKFSVTNIFLFSFSYELLLLFNLLNSIFKKPQWK